MTDNKELLTPEDEQLLQQFFTEHKQVIPDQGFTERLTQRLPMRTLLLEKVWTTFCIILCIVLFIAMDGIHLISRPFATFLHRCWERISQIPPIDFSFIQFYNIYVLTGAILLIIVGYKAITDNR